MKKILFVFDRVVHYHRDLFKFLERELAEQGVQLFLLSGESAQGAVGRVGLKEKVIEREEKYVFKEYKVKTFTFRRHFGVDQWILKHKPEVVVVQSHVGNITYWRLMGLKRRVGFKLVSWQCGYEYNPSAVKDMILRRFIKGFDHHLAYHSNARDYAVRYGAQSSQATVIHNTINEAKIALMPKEEARALLESRHPELIGRRIVLFVGAVLAEKRVETILEAFDLMRRDDIALLLVGDGEHLPVLRKLCEGRKDVVITGSIVEGVGPYFDASDVYVLPGTGGLGINEAMAHHLPIISGYADGSADDLVVDGVNGFRLRDGTSAELAEKIVAVLDDPSVATRMGATSREWITGKFAFQQFVNRISQVLVAL